MNIIFSIKGASALGPVWLSSKVHGVGFSLAVSELIAKLHSNLQTQLNFSWFE